MMRKLIELRFHPLAVSRQDWNACVRLAPDVAKLDSAARAYVSVMLREAMPSKWYARFDEALAAAEAAHV